MANKYEKEIIKDRIVRGNTLAANISEIFEGIRNKAFLQASTVVGKANGNDKYFSAKAGRIEKFAIDLNKDLRPDYLKKDNFVKDRVNEEYRTAYFESLYSVVNNGIDSGYLLKLPRYTKAQFQEAIRYPLSKLAYDGKLKTSRSIDLEQLFTNIVSGVERGDSLPNINKAIDQSLGFRDSTGKWIADKDLRKGQQYRTMRTLRTETLRMRATAETDQWVNQQPFVPSELMLIAVRDNRTRSQSAQVDGRRSNKEGKFLYPDGNYYFPHRTGIAKWDINDREYTITIDPEYPPESIIGRGKDGKNKVVPFRSFSEYAKENKLVKNKYGEYLFK